MCARVCVCVWRHSANTNIISQNRPTHTHTIHPPQPLQAEDRAENSEADARAVVDTELARVRAAMERAEAARREAAASATQRASAAHWYPEDGSNGGTREMQARPNGNAPPQQRVEGVWVTSPPRGVRPRDGWV